MFKNLMNGVSLSAMMLRDTDSNGSDPKAALREQLAKGNIPAKDANSGEQNADNGSDNESGDEAGEEDGDDDDESEEGEEGEEDDNKVTPPEDETEEQKKEREAKEKEAAKAQRKQDRTQRRIDRLVAEKKAAEAEVTRLKEQLAANPDQKLTAEEIEAQAEAKAAKKMADKELADLQAKFEADCDALAKVANKVDKQFDEKINELAEDIGPIPSFMIGVLADMDNGGEVLAYVANDDELAKPAKMTKLLVEISTKLTEAKKKPKKQISKVEAPGEPVKGSRVVSSQLTEADTKNMDAYVAKRQKMMMEKRKAQGF
jgi:hypothetical protein